MSQVIVTEDSLADKRRASAEQEQKIDVSSRFKQWRRSDITGRDLFATAVGLAVLPPLAFWFFLGSLATAIMYAVRYVLKALGGVVGGTKNLILPSK